jgi:hypothetical protein
MTRLAGRRRPGRAVAVAVVCAAVTAIGGCGLHTPSGVRIDQRSVDTSVDDPDIRKLPPGPAVNAKPQAIVEGFLEAAAADPDHSFAQAFLAPGASWPDRDTAVVYQPDGLRLGVVQTGPVSRVEVTAQAIGTLTPAGAFAPTDRQLAVSYQLRTVGGQWRITKAPAGVLLAPRDLSRGYRLIRTYAYNADRSALVPEPGYVVSDRAGLATAALHALLTDWDTTSNDLGVAPRSGRARPANPGNLASGLSALGSVVVRDGEATVDLGREAFTIPPSRRPLLVSQIAASLGSVPGVFSVRVLVEEREYIGHAVPASIPPAYEPGSPDPPVAVAPAGGLVTFTSSGATEPLHWRAGEMPLPAAADRAALRDPAVSPAGTALAAMLPGPAPVLMLARLTGSSGMQASSWRRVALPPPVDGQYLRPQWLDAQRLLMASTGTAPRLLLVDTSKGAIQPVTAPDLAHLGPLDSVSVSRDGTRIAAVIGAPGTRRAYVGRVITEPNGRGAGDRLVVTGWAAIPAQLTDVAAVSWSSDLTLTLLGQPTRTSPQLRAERFALDLASDPTVLPSLPTNLALTDGQPLAVISAPGRPTLISSGSLRWILHAGQWSPAPPAWDSAYS